MKTVKNRFGESVLYDIEDIVASDVYVVCTACMSVWSDFLSYANSDECYFNILPKYEESWYHQTEAIIVLGCQVTDLAIYNDLKTAEELHDKYPNIPIYMGGCLAHRFDIELPDCIYRLNVVRSGYQSVGNKELIDYRKPFWNKNLVDDADELETGNLFRHSYPLKIGAGCHGKCKYCTIRDTRGESYETDAYLQVAEFLANDDIVLISDSPTVKQIKDWCHIAERYNKPISMRNVEPQVAMVCTKELLDLSDKGLLKIFHCPIQSNDPNVLKAMNRNVGITLDYIEWAQELRKRGTKVATNIIIDYVVNGDVVHNMPEEWLNAHFDYWSWNPYFDGKWDYDKAKERFEKYIGEWSI